MNTHLMRIVMYNADINIKIKDKSALFVKQAFDKIERTLTSASFRNIFKSMTFDNGVEFSDIHGIENSSICKGKRTQLFFAHPYCFSERGSNENHNGIIRCFLSEGTDFALIPGKFRIG